MQKYPAVYFVISIMALQSGLQNRYIKLENYKA